MVVKFFYHGHMCAEISVDYFGFNDVFSDGEWIGISDCKIVCRIDDGKYEVVETDYGFEVNKVV